MIQFAKSVQPVTGSAIRDIFKIIKNTDIISFAGGNPSAASFPCLEIQEITKDLLAEHGTELLQYSGTEGYVPLKESIIDYILKPKGINATQDQMLILTGSSQGLDLIARTFLDPGDAVLCESPTFLGMLQTFKLAQANLISVEMDEEGVIIEDLEDKIRKYKPKLFYCIPTFQNPTGKTLTLERRKKIARLARQYDMYVIEDDPYCDLRYSGEAVASIKSFDLDEHVILLNSFSKTISPGLRVGVAVGKPEVIRKMTIIKQGADTHTPNLNQAIVDQFLRREFMQSHLKKIIPGYKRQRDAMLEGIQMHFPADFQYTKPDGGLFIWGKFAYDIDLKKTLIQSVDTIKVAFIPGEYFYIDPAVGKNTIRMNFSAASPKDIAIGVERLGTMLKQLQLSHITTV